MGVWGSILNWWHTRGLKDYRILMLGLDNAGKTTILYRLKLNKTIAAIPTLGFNIESISVGDNIKLTVWDVGGHAARRMYRHYTVNSNGLIYVIDSTDTERFIEAKEALEGVLDHEDMRGVPVLVIANKQDMQDYVKARQIVKVLDLTSLDGRQWYVKNASAKTGEGLIDAMKQLAAMVEDFKAKQS